MSKPKIITELSEEELLKLLENTDNNSGPIFHFQNDVIDFLSFYAIRSGKFKVPCKNLFLLYRRWSKAPLKSAPFTSQMTDLFESKGRHRVVLLLNRSAFDLKNEYNKYLKRQQKTKRPNWKKHFDAYLNFYSIEKGGLFIKDVVLYNLYDKWTYKNNSRNPISFFQFVNFCKVYFKVKLINHHHWFAINKKIIQHLSENHLEELKKR